MSELREYNGINSNYSEIYGAGNGNYQSTLIYELLLAEVVSDLVYRLLIAREWFSDFF